MFNQNDSKLLREATAYCKDGNKIGAVGDVYMDDETNEPTWVTVNTGLFGMKSSFAPLEGARLEGDRLVLAHGKDKVKDAPRIDEDGHLTPAEEEELYRYYGQSERYAGFKDADRDAQAGLAGTAGGVAAGQGVRDGRTDGLRDDRTDGVRDDRADVAGLADRSREDASARDSVRDRDVTEVPVHEERLTVDKETRETGQVRLRKVTRTENQQVTVPVTKEQVVVERVPGSGDVKDAAIGDQDGDQTVTLHEEVPVVNKETVETERVRLSKETVTERQEVGGEVRKEEVKVEGDNVPGLKDRARDGVDGLTDRNRDGVTDRNDLKGDQR